MWSAGPRASQYLILGAKARAMLHGRLYAGTEDVRAVAHPVLRHRIITNFNAEAEGIQADDIVRLLMDVIKTDRGSSRRVRKLERATSKETSVRIGTYCIDRSRQPRRIVRRNPSNSR